MQLCKLVSQISILTILGLVHWITGKSHFYIGIFWRLRFEFCNSCKKTVYYAGMGEGRYQPQYALSKSPSRDWSYLANWISSRCSSVIHFVYSSHHAKHFCLGYCSIIVHVKQSEHPTKFLLRRSFADYSWNFVYMENTKHQKPDLSLNIILKKNKGPIDRDSLFWLTTKIFLEQPFFDPRKVL